MIKLLWFPACNPPVGCCGPSPTYFGSGGFRTPSPGLSFSPRSGTLRRVGALTLLEISHDARLQNHDAPARHSDRRVRRKRADRPVGAAPARYLYVWAGTGNDTTDGVDMMTVIDANSASATYATILAAVPVDSSGRMPHHTEFTLPATGPLFANDYSGDKSFLVDFSTPEAPAHPAPGERSRRPAVAFIRAFAQRARAGHGAVWRWFRAGRPGWARRVRRGGKPVRSGWSRDSTFPNARIRTYAITVVPESDRVVTTSTPMDNEKTANVVQVWRLSDLRLLKTLPVPEIAGDSTHVYPFEVRTLADGSVMLNTYGGFFHLGSERSPRIDRVMTMPRNFGCSVPVISDSLMIMPIAYAHRFATIDISDPLAPREIASWLPIPASSRTGPPPIRSNRLVVTDQGDGLPMVKILHLDRSTGRLSWDQDSGTPVPRRPA